MHRALGPGLLESAYVKALLIELDGQSFRLAWEVEIEGRYKEQPLGVVYRADIVVEDLVVIECKCVEKVLPVHRAQLLTYVRQGGYGIGLLFNFSGQLVMDGFERVVNGDYGL